MCGIVGIVGREAVTPRLVEGLQRLDPRSDAEAVAWVTASELDGYGVNAHAAAVIRKGLEYSFPS